MSAGGVGIRLTRSLLGMKNPLPPRRPFLPKFAQEIVTLLKLTRISVGFLQIVRPTGHVAVVVIECLPIELLGADLRRLWPFWLGTKTDNPHRSSFLLAVLAIFPGTADPAISAENGPEGVSRLADWHLTVHHMTLHFFAGFFLDFRGVRHGPCRYFGNLRSLLLGSRQRCRLALGPSIYQGRNEHCALRLIQMLPVQLLADEGYQV